MLVCGQLLKQSHRYALDTGRVCIKKSPINQKSGLGGNSPVDVKIALQLLSLFLPSPAPRGSAAALCGEDGRDRHQHDLDVQAERAVLRIRDIKRHAAPVGRVAATADLP